ncbi:MAG: hypothetical protein OIN86_11625 [Candidatus Methanoperedens sp.]|nr:hypothetical protein [Candidatus Methanoperedens sp.]CAG0990838.1 hypothetical protein METP1_02287 [Methanosarcinales archaeon]
MSSKDKNPNSYVYSFRFACLILIVFIFLIAPAGAANLEDLNNSCINCHKSLSPFTDEQIRFNDIRSNHTDRNISCSLECHEDFIRKKASDNFQQWSDSGHSSYFVTCDACHGGNPDVNTEAGSHSPIKNITDPESPIYYKNIPETCGKCHSTELEHFKNTMHYQRLSAEKRAPSCVNCHQPHSFKVLKASEITPLCSVCHNQKDQVSSANVPKDAKIALEKADELKEEIRIARNSISEAKAKGNNSHISQMEIASAQNDLDKAISVMKDVPSLWHSFDLKDFDRQIQVGIDSAKNAQGKISEVEQTIPPVPGIGIVLVMGIFAILYLIRKK